MSEPDTSEPQSVEEVLGELDELAAAQRRVCIADVLDDFGSRSFGIFILIPPLIEFSPLGGIPGVPSLLALVVAITAAQLFIGKEHVWMPQFIQSRSISSRRLHRALMRLRGMAHWLDERSHNRLESLVEGIWVRIAAAIIIVLCCAVPPLELLPFASSLPMLPIAAFGLALTVRDGMLMAIALPLGLAGVAVGGHLLLAGPLG